jgi:superfamily II DNA or RNA helicase
LLTFSLTSDKLHLELVSYSHKSELKDFQFYFKKRQKGYLFNRLYKRKLWDGYDHFVTLDKETGIARIGVGLWKEILNFSKKYGYQVNIQDLDSLFNIGFTKDQVDKFSSVMLDGSDIDARDYQLEAVFRALKYKFCSLELATSAGKTIIFFLYLAFLKRKGILKSEGQKALIVVPRSGLVGQTAEKFEGDYNTGLMKFNVMSIGGKNKFKEKDFESADIVISTYQSLINRPPEFFKNFRIVCVDECHTSRGNSIRDILLNSTNAEYKLGLSGTIKIEDEYSDFFRIQEYLGPLSMVLKASHLIENNYSPDVYIKMLYLDYPPDEPFVKTYLEMRDAGRAGKDLYDAEKAFIVSYEPRIDFISKFVSKLPGNTLILYINVKDGYGQRICDRIKDWNEHVYYIDGGVDSDDRDGYQRIMESGSGVVLVASFGTFSTGIDLKNVNHIILAESYKSEVTIRQSIGRGMRGLKGKVKVVIYDLIDDLRGYVVKHGAAREKIYVKEKFILSKHRFDLTKFAKG